MAIAFRAGDSAGTSLTNLVINKPAGTVDGDVMLAFINARQDNTVTCTPPAGWVERVSVARGTGGRLFVYSKVASGEGASYTFTLSQSSAHSGTILSYSGVDNTNPVDVVASTDGGTGSSTSCVTPSVTTTIANAEVVRAAIAISTTAAGSFTWPTSNERSDFNYTSGSIRTFLSTASLSKAAAGAAGTETATANQSVVRAMATIALKPADGGGDPPASGDHMMLLGI